MGRRVVDDVAVGDAVIVRADPGVDPERLDAHDLLLLVPHRAGDVHHVEDDGVGDRLRLFLPRAVAHVLANRGHHRRAVVVAAGGELPLQRLAVGSAKRAERLGARGADALVPASPALEGTLAPGFDARQLQLFTEQVGKLLDRDLDLAQVDAGLVAGSAVPARLAAADGGAFVPVALPDAGHLLPSVSDLGQLDLRQRNRDDLAAALADQLAARDVLAQVLLDATPDDGVESLPVPLDPLDRGEAGEGVSDHSSFSLTSPRAKMLATKFSTSVAQMSQ